RYRLYDLGGVVSRTVSYAVVTAMLIGTYLALVASSTRLLPSGSSLAVAASTLAAAALFQPLRRHVQTVVDRRFNRARYDADRTVVEFTRRLRDEVDLAAVRADLLSVVRRTMQPSTVSLWLREPR
ncbi:MAG: histidine kinase, partial [Propionibacteriales bacterium]|nr:histidine kinase [Propionibacteriales bacterium]